MEWHEVLGGMRRNVVRRMGHWEGILMAHASDPAEWETLMEMRIADAAAWCAKRRVTPS